MIQYGAMKVPLDKYTAAGMTSVLFKYHTPYGHIVHIKTCGFYRTSVILNDDSKCIVISEYNNITGCVSAPQPRNFSSLRA